MSKKTTKKTKKMDNHISRNPFRVDGVDHTQDLEAKTEFIDDKNMFNTTKIENIEPSDLLKQVFTQADTKEQNTNFDMKEFSQAYKEVISSLTNTEGNKLYKLTDLDKNKVFDINLLFTLGKYYNFQSLQNFSDNLFTLLISKERKGRSELLQVGQLLNQLHSLQMVANSPMGMAGMGMGGMGGMGGMNTYQQPIIQHQQSQPRKRRFLFF